MDAPRFLDVARYALSLRRVGQVGSVVLGMLADRQVLSLAACCKS